MPTSRASVDLLAPIDDVWAFVSEPYNLPDWWPGLGSVEPDRRGFATGARWLVRTREPSLFQRAEAEDTLLVTAAEPMRFAFELVRARIRAELRLGAAGAGRTNAHLLVEEPFSLAFRRGRRAKDALDLLYDRVQTAAAV